MEVPISNLLSQAERLVSDRKKDSQSKSNDTTRVTGKDSLELASNITSKFHTVQTKLGELQVALSREQAKIALLQDKEAKPESSLQDILFEDAPLFSSAEVETAKTNPTLLLQTAQIQLESLTQAIRQKEIESENLVSSGQIQNWDQVQSALQKLSSNSLKPIPEKTVLRLVQG